MERARFDIAAHLVNVHAVYICAACGQTCRARIAMTSEILDRFPSGEVLPNELTTPCNRCKVGRMAKRREMSIVEGGK